MAGLVPEGLTRLGVTAFVRDAELSATDRSSVIRCAAEQMAEQALRKLLNDCIKTESGYMGYRGQTLRLDVYVMAPEELHRALAEARMQGEHDAMRWIGLQQSMATHGCKTTGYEESAEEPGQGA